MKSIHLTWLTSLLKLGILCFVLLAMVSSYSQVALAQTDMEFREYMLIWDEKRELASQYLLKAEASFKEGNELVGCASQQKASFYGIEATNALITAMELNGTEDGIDDLKVGLNKWRELGDFC